MGFNEEMMKQFMDIAISGISDYVAGNYFISLHFNKVTYYFVFESHEVCVAMSEVYKYLNRA